jgi:hypothetical protein
MEVGNCNLVYEVLADVRLVISCQNKEFPSDAEWDSWLGATMNLEHKVETFQLLVLTDGGHPTKAQIERMRAKNRSNPRTAIISPSRGYRFMGSALTFINPTIRCFSLEDSEKAFDHIGLARGDRERATRTIESLQLRLTRRSSAA